MSDDMLREVHALRERFAQEVLYCADADDAGMRAAGWQDRTLWLRSIVARYRKEMHRVCDD